MIKIRLDRGGVIKKPYYTVVAIDERAKRGAKPLASLGFWQPSTETKKIDLKAVKEWVTKGAQVTPAVKTLFDIKI